MRMPGPLLLLVISLLLLSPQHWHPIFACGSLTTPTDIESLFVTIMQFAG